MEIESNYIGWLIQLEHVLKNQQIEYSEYDEFYIEDAIATVEIILTEYNIDTITNLTEAMVDDYARHAIAANPLQQEYFDTVTFYVKKRLLCQ